MFRYDVKAQILGEGRQCKQKARSDLKNIVSARYWIASRSILWCIEGSPFSSLPVRKYCFPNYHLPKTSGLIVDSWYAGAMSIAVASNFGCSRFGSHDRLITEYVTGVCKGEAQVNRTEVSSDTKPLFNMHNAPATFLGSIGMMVTSIDCLAKRQQQPLTEHDLLRVSLLLQTMIRYLNTGCKNVSPGPRSA